MWNRLLLLFRRRRRRSQAGQGERRTAAARNRFWAQVRDDWSRLETSAPAFGLTIQGEPEPLYIPILTLADDVQAGKITTDAAVVEAKNVIARFTTTNVGTLESRIAKATQQADAGSKAAAK